MLVKREKQSMLSITGSISYFLSVWIVVLAQSVQKLSFASLYGATHSAWTTEALPHSAASGHRAFDDVSTCNSGYLMSMNARTCHLHNQPALRICVSSACSVLHSGRACFDGTE